MAHDEANGQLFAAETKNRYPLDQVASALQKAIRRGDEHTALFFALELFPKYAAYAWRRIMVTSVEDIEDPAVCGQIEAMRSAFFWNNKDVKKAEDFKNRIFITKAVITLCRARHSREADHAQHFIDQEVKAKHMRPIPDYAHDVHTHQGRMAGKTKTDFFADEQSGLINPGRDDYFKLLNF